MSYHSLELIQLVDVLVWRHVRIFVCTVANWTLPCFFVDRLLVPGQNQPCIVRETSLFLATLQLMIILGNLWWSYVRLTFKINLLSTASVHMCNSKSLSLLRVSSETLRHVFTHSRTDFTNWLNANIFINSAQCAL